MSAMFQSLVVMALLVVVHGRGLRWWWHALASGEGTLHLVVVLGVVVGVVLDLRRRGRSVELPVHLHPLGLGLTLGALLGSWCTAPARLGVLDAAWVWLTMAGLVAMKGGVVSLRRAAPPLVLAALVVPQMGHLEALVGVPLRLGTASAVARVLSAAGRAAVDQGTVLVVDGQATAIDLPCSGVRSLWTGLAVFVAASWLDRRQVGLRWGGLALGTGALLVLANGLRVLLLAGLAHSGLPGGEVAAAVFHEPLGVLGFVAALAVGLWSLRGLPIGAEVPATPGQCPTVRRGWPVLAVVALCVAGVPRADAVPSNPHLPPPPGLVAVDPPAAELERVAVLGGRLSVARFEMGDFTGPASALAGELVLVVGTSARLHHRPDICLRSSGASTAEVLPARVAERDVRTVLVDTADGPARSVWWFRSRSGSTGSHSRHLLQSLWSAEPRVLVSVLVRSGASPISVDDPRLADLVDQLDQHAEYLLTPSSGAFARLELP